MAIFLGANFSWLMYLFLMLQDTKPHWGSLATRLFLYVATCEDLFSFKALPSFADILVFLRWGGGWQMLVAFWCCCVPPHISYFLNLEAGYFWNTSLMKYAGNFLRKWTTVKGSFRVPLHPSRSSQRNHWFPYVDVTSVNVTNIGSLLGAMNFWIFWLVLDVTLFSFLTWFCEATFFASNSQIL